MKRKALEPLDKNGRTPSASNRTPKRQSTDARHKSRGKQSTLNRSGRHRRTESGPLWNTETKTPRISNCAEKATELRTKTRNLRATEPGTSPQNIRGTNGTGGRAVQTRELPKYARTHRQTNLIDRQSKEVEMDVESPGMLSEFSGLEDEPSTTESGTKESFQESALKRIAAAVKSSPTAKRAKLTRLETSIGQTSKDRTGKTNAQDCVPIQITIKSQTKHERSCEAGQDRRSARKFVDFEHEPRPQFFSDGTFEELRKHALSPDNKQVFDAVNKGKPRFYQQQDGLSGITIGGPRLKRVDSLEDEDITIDSHGSMYVNPNTNSATLHDFKRKKETDLSSEQHRIPDRMAMCATKDEQKHKAFIDSLYNETIIHNNTGLHEEKEDQSTKDKAKDTSFFVPCRSPEVLCCPEVWSLPDEEASTNSKNFVFEIKGKKFYHPALPPGWKLEVAASQSRPFYVHPDHGLTYYCPVPLPVKPRQIMPGNKLQVRTNATAQFPKHTSTREYCHLNRHLSTEIARHPMEVQQSSGVHHLEHFAYDSSNNDDDESSLMLSPLSACIPPGLKKRLPPLCPTTRVLSSTGRSGDCNVRSDTRSLEDMDMSSQTTHLFSSASSDDEGGDGSMDRTGETYSAQTEETQDPEIGWPDEGSDPSEGHTLAMEKLSVNTIEQQNQWRNDVEKSGHKEDGISSIESVGGDHICCYEVQKTGQEQDGVSLGFHGSNEDEDGGLAPSVQEKATLPIQAKSADLESSSPLATHSATTTGRSEKNIEIDAKRTNICAEVGKMRLPVASSSTSATSVQSTDNALVQGTPNVPVTTQKSELENDACVPAKNGSTCSSSCMDSDTEEKGANVVETVAVVCHAMDKHERPLVIKSPSNLSSSSSPHPRVVNLEESNFSQADDNSPIVVNLEESNFSPADHSPRVVSFEESNFPSADDDEASVVHSRFNGKRLDEVISKTSENSVQSGSVAGCSLSATGSHTPQISPHIFYRTVKMPDRQCSLQNLAKFREKGRYPYRFSASGKFPEPRMPVARKKQ